MSYSPTEAALDALDWLEKLIPIIEAQGFAHPYLDAAKELLAMRDEMIEAQTSSARRQ